MCSDFLICKTLVVCGKNDEKRPFFTIFTANDPFSGQKLKNSKIRTHRKFLTTLYYPYRNRPCGISRVLSACSASAYWHALSRVQHVISPINNSRLLDTRNRLLKTRIRLPNKRLLNAHNGTSFNKRLLSK